MIQYFPTITGSLTVNGDLIVTGTGSMSASLALNSNLLQGTGSTGFATTSSLLAVSSSQQQISASLLTLTASYAALSSSYTALSGSYNTFSGSASTRVSQIESVYATTGSNSFRANQSITGSLVVSSTITAQTLVVQTVTSSIVYSSGSNLFGNQLSNNQTFTGSVNITGSLALAGNITSNGTAVVLGSGTTNYLPKFTALSTIGDSAITDNGTTVTLVSRALSGTTADFLTTTASRYLQIRDAGTSTPSLRSVNDTIAQLRAIAIEANTISLRTGASSGLTVTEALAISATGAATFSSTLLTGGDITVSKTGDSGLNINSTTTNGVAVTRYKTTAAGNLWGTGINITGADSRWEVYNFTLGASPFILSNAGAASFASSLYAASTISSGTSIAAATYVSAPSGFYTTSNNNSIPFTTWTTLTTVDSNVMGLYLVVIGLSNQVLTDWAATGILYSSGAYATWIVGPTNGSLVQLRISGTAIQVYQNGGSPSQTLYYKLLKIA